MRRILIIRGDNIGDAVLFSGTLKCIRASNPGARIDLMLKSHVLNLFEFCPYVDRLLPFERVSPFHILRNYFFRGTSVLERILRSDTFNTFWPYPSYDLVVCPVRSPSEDLLDVVRHINGTYKWGFVGDDLNNSQPRNLKNIADLIYTSCFKIDANMLWMHELDVLQQFLLFFGIEAGDVFPEFWQTDQDYSFARKQVPASKSLGIFIGASHWWRKWPVPRWVALLEKQNLFDNVSIFGGEGDRRAAKDIRSGISSSRLNINDLTGRTTLREMVACIGACKCMVSTDSAGLHMATALRMPTVGIMCGYHYGRYYPWGDRRINRVARIEMDCYHCNGDCKYSDYRCIQGIPVDSVLKELNASICNAY